MRVRWSARFVLVGLVVLAASAAQAEVRLPAVIGDHMVLQRGQELPIWGWDTPGTEVTVTLGNAKATAKADPSSGKWCVRLPAMPAGGPVTMTVQGTNTVTVSDILIGEVWICSGQSNMEWTVRNSNDADQEIAAADHPRLRHIKINHVPAKEPQEVVPSGGWEVCSPQTVASFTAAGYYFGRHLQQELEVPIGLIGSNWGGTRIEPWTPPVGFQSVPALKDVADRLDTFPSVNNDGKINHQSPLALYNGMIHPLVPFGVRGAIWYQGESNNGEGMLYYEKMKALILGWRKVWQNDEMAFYYVQLAPYRYGADRVSALPGIWEAQTAALGIPHTGMAVTVDISNITDIHPRNKQDVGKRLALWALAKDYGQTDICFSGPLYKSMTVEGSKVRIAFDHVCGGLLARDGQPLTHFTIAAEDKDFVEAKAEIDGQTVVVHADAVANPVAVRFGWHQEAEPNLSNKAGLPASPFRTDKW